MKALGTLLLLLGGLWVRHSVLSRHREHIQMGEELLEGRVQASPVMKNKNTCQYCPYSPVCAREYSEKDVETDRPDSARSLAQMRETLEKGEIPNG